MLFRSVSQSRYSDDYDVTDGALQNRSSSAVELVKGMNWVVEGSSLTLNITGNSVHSADIKLICTFVR